MLNTESALRKDKRTGLWGDMQHRHYATIAAIIASMPLPRRLTVAREFADYLPATNPRFDRTRFLKACEG